MASNPEVYIASEDARDVALSNYLYPVLCRRSRAMVGLSGGLTGNAS